MKTIIALTAYVVVACLIAIAAVISLGFTMTVGWFMGGWKRNVKARS